MTSQFLGEGRRMIDLSCASGFVFFLKECGWMSLETRLPDAQISRYHVT